MNRPRPSAADLQDAEAFVAATFDNDQSLCPVWLANNRSNLVRQAADLAMIRRQERGSQVEYRGDGTDRCPGCARGQFYVGRISAECAFCGAAVPLARQEIAPFSGRRAA